MADTKQQQETEFVAFVGIDWADQKHAWALQLPGQLDVERGDLNHTPEAVDAWAAELARRFGGRPIAVTLEQSRGSLVFMLTKYAYLVLFPVNPATLANYRKGFRPSGAKSDPSDAGLLVNLLVHHREKLRRLHPDTQGQAAEHGVQPDGSANITRLSSISTSRFWSHCRISVSPSPYS